MFGEFLARKRLEAGRLMKHLFLGGTSHFRTEYPYVGVECRGPRSKCAQFIRLGSNSFDSNDICTVLLLRLVLRTVYIVEENFPRCYSI